MLHAIHGQIPFEIYEDMVEMLLVVCVFLRMTFSMTFAWVADKDEGSDTIADFLSLVGR